MINDFNSSSCKAVRTANQSGILSQSDFDIATALANLIRTGVSSIQAAVFLRSCHLAIQSTPAIPKDKP